MGWDAKGVFDSIGAEVKTSVKGTKLCILAGDDTVVMKEWQTQSTFPTPNSLLPK
jgi:hypothetical protein